MGERMRIPPLGKIVRVIFLDHTQSKGGCEVGIIKCTVWGKLVRRDRKSIEVRTWESEFNGTKDSPNHECYTLIRSAITEIEVIE